MKVKNSDYKTLRNGKPSIYWASIYRVFRFTVSKIIPPNNLIKIKIRLTVQFD